MKDILEELLQDINDEYAEIMIEFKELNMDIDCNPYWTGYVDALDRVCEMITNRL